MSFKISILYVITRCSPLKVNRRFGRTYPSVFRVEANEETTMRADGKLCVPANPKTCVSTQNNKQKLVLKYIDALGGS
jgi:hypothetical protein